MKLLYASLILGLVLRPLQIMVVCYLIYRQWKQLRRLSPFQRIKQLLMAVLLINLVLFSFSLFIDLVGMFGWFKEYSIVFLSLYLIVNTLSATAITTLLLVMYRSQVEGVEH